MKILLLAEAANPEWTSVPLVGYNQAAALSEVLDVHLVTQVRNRDALCRKGLREGEDFTAIDSERAAGPLHRIATIMGLGSGRAWSLSTGLASIAYLYFERLAWQIFGERLAAGEFAAVHRITPVSPATPSPMAAHCRKVGVPFILGPINGGLSWPKGFSAERLREGEIWSAFRGLRRLMPSSRRTLSNATRILVGSSTAMGDLPTAYREKAIAMPENGIFGDQFPEPTKRERGKSSSGPLQFAWAGRLVPCKGMELGIKALVPLLQSGDACLKIFGDGSERQRLMELVNHEGVAGAVEFAGWLPQPELLSKLAQADVFLFPSIREFGGGALLEAMACGLYPIVVDYGGPPEICGETGYRVPLGTREEIVTAIRSRAQHLCDNPNQINKLGLHAWRRARTFSWDEKAKFYCNLYEQLDRERIQQP